MTLFIRRTELMEQIFVVGKVTLKGATFIGSKPPLAVGASFGSTALTTRFIVINPLLKVLLDITLPIAGRDLPPIEASTNVAVSTGIARAAFQVNVAGARSFVPSKSNLSEQVPALIPVTYVLLTIPPVRSQVPWD